MVGRDVQQNSYVCMEVIHIVELERTEFYDIVFMWVFCHLLRKTSAYVAGKSGVISCFLEDMVYERGRCSLSVTARYAYHLWVGISSGKLYFRDDTDTVFFDFLHHGGCPRDAGALDNFLCIQYKFLGVLALLIRDFPFFEHLYVFVGDFPHIGEENIKPFDFCEDCGSHSAFSSA